MSKTSKEAVSTEVFKAFGLVEEERAMIRHQRTVLLTSPELDGVSSSEFIKDFFILTNSGSKKPVHILISSEGGSLWSCLAIIRAIRYAQSKGIKVHGHVFGNAFSAAFFILQACDWRTMGVESVLMMHGISHFPCGDSKNVKQDQNMIDQVSSQFCGMLAARNTSPDPQYKDAETLIAQMEDATPNYFMGEDALKAGWIDEIDP